MNPFLWDLLLFVLIYYAHKEGPSYFFLYMGSMGFEGYISFIGILDSLLFKLICLAYVMTMSLLLNFFIGCWDTALGELNISHILWLPWVCLAFYRQAPLVEGLLLLVKILSWSGSIT